MIAFTNTLRATPIVLTEHQIVSLCSLAGCDICSVAGFDVRKQLETMRNEPFDAKTLGQLMRVLESRVAGLHSFAGGR